MLSRLALVVFRKGSCQRLNRIAAAMVGSHPPNLITPSDDISSETPQLIHRLRTVKIAIL